MNRSIASSSIPGEHEISGLLDTSRSVYLSDPDVELRFSATPAGDAIGCASLTGDFRGGDTTGDREARAISAGRYRSGGSSHRECHMAPDGRFLLMRRADTGQADNQALGRICVILDGFHELVERVPD